MPGVSEFVRDAILGLLILLAVASDKVLFGRFQQTWASAQATREARREAEAASG